MPAGRGYMSQLDALRFFAIMGVIVQHNWRPRPLPWIFGPLDWGMLGVRLFFVLSGFLITGILIGGRETGERDPERRLFFVRQFYVRRFLRIFPIYYLTLVLVLASGVEPARQVWPWLFSYTTNVYIWHNLHWIGHLSHFWTLAVEEQFYLVWPWLMLFLPRRWLVPLLVALVCLAPLYRLYASFHYAADAAYGGYTSFTLAVGVLDSLGLGALLAFAASADRGGERLRRVLTRVVLPVGAAGYVTLLAVWRYGDARHVPLALAETTLALIFCWLVGGAARGFRGPVGAVFEWRPIVYLGRISYGIYIFHNLVPVAFGAAATRLGIGYEDVGVLNFVVSSLATFALAALSWRLFEGPINGLKRWFRYDRDRDAHPVTTVAPAR
jgi:peptidoglycan/LPS O-acetylase OafA/YrhL